MSIGTGIIDKIQIVLNAQWNASIIAKPPFINGRLQPTTVVLPGIRIEDLGSTLDPGDLAGGSDLKRTSFKIMCFAETELECRKLVYEVKRIINANTPSEGGVWRVTGVEPFEGDDFSTYEVYGIENVLSITVGW